MKILTDYPSLMLLHSFDKKYWGIIEADPFLNGCRKAQRGF